MNANAPSIIHRAHRRHGSVVVVVLWAIAVAAIITSSVQLFAQRQALVGREELQRIQARWAARSGVEATLAVMTEETLKPHEDDALALVRDMYYVDAGSTINASYSILHNVDGRDYGGPMDEHSKLNINRTDDRALLMSLDGMTFDLLDAIGDWIDEDNEISTLGVERDYYRGLDHPYEPRNGPMQSLGEIELVAGVWPKYFRGEDWNLDNRLDPNENDGGLSFPPDQPDGILDAGWSGRLTVYSVAGGPTMSGEPRIFLRDATVDDLTHRLDIDATQAQALLDFGKNSANSLSDLLFNPLGGSTSSNQNGANQNQGRSQTQPQQQMQQQGKNLKPQNGGVTPLTDKQLRAVFNEVTMDDPLDRKPGKMNLNSVSTQFLRDIISFLGLDETIADEILYLRDSRAQGIVSIADLMSIPDITPEELKAITQRFDTISSVYTISSRGRSSASGLEVEIVAVVDRSTVPVKILEYREQ